MIISHIDSKKILYSVNQYKLRVTKKRLLNRTGDLLKNTIGKQSQKQADGKNHCLQNVTKVENIKNVVTKYFSEAT